MEKSLYGSLLKCRALCLILFVRLRLFVFLLLIIQSPGLSAATNQEPVAQQPLKLDSHSADGEVVQSNAGATFKIRTDLVVVHVVVRDAEGKTIGNLKKEDFELFDNHKPQIISNFSVETLSFKSFETPTEAESPGTKPGTIPGKESTFPRKFIALYFDDLHLSIADVGQSVSAARKLLEQKKPSERFAVFTSSGRVEQNFTHDQEFLNTALLRITPQPVRHKLPARCPPQISYYQAYQIAEVENPQVLQVVMDDFAQCPGSPTGKETLEREVQAEAHEQLVLGETDVRTGLRNLQSIIRRMSGFPGQRIIALLSPGFFVPPSISETSQAIDLATRAHVVVHAIDTRGVYLLEVGADASSSRRTPPSPAKIQVASIEQHADEGVLSELADGTGGLYFHGRNDIDVGLLQATAEPEFSYVLGFSPRGLKRDGKYHALKVSLRGKLYRTIQARQGYFPPREPEDPEAAAKQELELAVASRDAMPDLVIQCQTFVHKDVSGNFRLTVAARIDAKSFRFQKSGDRNTADLRVVAALFDGNGNIVTARQNSIAMALRDSTLAIVNKTGIRARFQFDVLPGTYLLRVVARESVGPLMGATERPVVVP